MRIVVLCLVGTCALGGLATSSASAALPELGRCVKLATKTGVFNRSNCLGVSAKHIGEYEWESGPGAKKELKAILNGAIFETVGATKISCASGQLIGEYTGAKALKLSEVVLDGCELVSFLHQKCYTNPLEPGKILSKTPLVGELGPIPGAISPTNPWAGWDLKSENSSLPALSFTCGEGGGTIAVTLEGSVIGRVTKTNVMASEFGFNFKQKAGIQSPTAFIGGTEDVLSESLQPLGGTKTTEQAGLGSGMTVTDGESLEIKAKV